jgi:hypothetical protein
MSNSRDVIVIDDSIFYEIEELFEERVKELEEKKKLEEE